MVLALRAVGAVSGFEKVAVYTSSDMILSSSFSARVSPPRMLLVAGFRPSSWYSGTEKSPFGPASLAYEFSLPDRCMELKSGFGEGLS